MKYWVEDIGLGGDGYGRYADMPEALAAAQDVVQRNGGKVSILEVREVAVVEARAIVKAA